jgi:hypothetical protein
VRRGDGVSVSDVDGDPQLDEDVILVAVGAAGYDADDRPTEQWLREPRTPRLEVGMRRGHRGLAELLERPERDVLIGAPDSATQKSRSPCCTTSAG